MPVLYQLVLKVNHEHVERVDADRFETNNNFVHHFAGVLIFFLHDVHVTVSNIELVGPLDQVLTWLFWVLHVD